MVFVAKRICSFLNHRTINEEVLNLCFILNISYGLNMCLKVKMVQDIQVHFVSMGRGRVDGTFVCSRLGRQKCQDYH